mmetsp:Transcript_61460/g.84466  ORF Transcript_61460/g.84466 Transcript_61460/m.84466 type:complete len:407 (-) Transcript_61460:466-1686(-)|eukprot:CAMPEP_0185747086 /NCGR_PEP_ID=MMETSP1174-20130828/5747_1 /TAXON_ID=35687 /ORGANISM="Dictyocha speculum, Strain CCMP1381" /LENGTH=406 /DNA_ID=CAMNT_0028422121 /DNA_START=189 /DNA_END=1409 /DNA_ORIENTATION=-
MGRPVKRKAKADGATSLSKSPEKRVKNEEKDEDSKKDIVDVEELEKVGFEILQYNEGEGVMALDQSRLYRAKVVKSSHDAQYFIHFQGWNKKWDKWVHASILMKEGPAALKYANKLHEEQKKRDAKKISDKVLGTDDGKASRGRKSKEPRVDVGRGLEYASDDVAVMKIALPFTLKKQLVMDWERLSQASPPMLVSLPRNPSVHDIIKQFLDFKAKRASTSKQLHFSELLDGLKIYFDKALGYFLLYPAEHAQYDLITRKFPGEPASKIYGAEHLLRLFTKLPDILGRVRLAAVEESQLQASFGEFLKFMQKNSASLFPEEYEEGVVCPPDSIPSTSGTGNDTQHTTTKVPPVPAASTAEESSASRKNSETGADAEQPAPPAPPAQLLSPSPQITGSIKAEKTDEV